MIVGMVSSYQEGALAHAAVRSLTTACDAVYVLEGPIGPADPPEAVSAAMGGWQQLSREKTARSVVVRHGAWASDAAKRTDLLHWVNTREQMEPVWAVVLDGDELLLYGEQLRPVTAYLEQLEQHTGQVQMGTGLRVLEDDGSCAYASGRLIRADYVEAYTLSSMTMLLKNGVEVTRPHFALRLGGEPDLDGDHRHGGAQLRRPLAGEPHILHRSHLRPPGRQAARLHTAELDSLGELMEASGLTRSEAPVRTGGVEVWLPAGG